MAKETFSMRWQVLHSKVCSSKPVLPGKFRANPILCLQVRHIGRSTMEDGLRIARHPLKRYAFQNKLVCPVPDTPTKFWCKSLGLRAAGTASRRKAAASNRASESRQNRNLASEGFSEKIGRSERI